MRQLDFNHEFLASFLVINQQTVLTNWAIESVIQNSNIPIVIGYLQKSDIANLPISERISYLDLNSNALDLGIKTGGERYYDFSEDFFFSLVQLKWRLFLRIFQEFSPKFLIYSDTDVMWLKPVVEVIKKSFANFHNLEMLVQNSSETPDIPQLCMGFAVFKNDSYCYELITEAAQLHRNLLKVDSRVGDDDIISKIYVDRNRPSNIQILPQSTFPVGNFLNLFSTSNKFPGLYPFEPFIFHSNYVVGKRNKLLLTYRFLSMRKKEAQYMSLKVRTELYLFFHFYAIFSGFRDLLHKIKSLLNR